MFHRWPSPHSPPLDPINPGARCSGGTGGPLPPLVRCSSGSGASTIWEDTFRFHTASYMRGWPSCLRSLPLPGCGGRPASQGRSGPIWQRKWARFLHLQARESAMLPLPKPVLSASGWGDMGRRSHSWLRKGLQLWSKEPRGPDPLQTCPPRAPGPALTQVPNHVARLLLKFSIHI